MGVVRRQIPDSHQNLSVDDIAKLFLTNIAACCVPN